MKFKSRYLQPVKTSSSEGGGKEAEERNGFHAAGTPPPPPRRESATAAAGPPLAYRYPEAFTVDLENGCVRFGFRCLISGSEGAGTEFLYFDTAGRVSKALERSGEWTAHTKRYCTPWYLHYWSSKARHCSSLSSQ